MGTAELTIEREQKVQQRRRRRIWWIWCV